MSKRINSYQAVASFVRGFFEAYARGIMDAVVGGDEGIGGVDIGAEVAGVAEGRRAEPHVHLARARLP